MGAKPHGFGAEIELVRSGFAAGKKFFIAQFDLLGLDCAQRLAEQFGNRQT